MNFKIQLKQAKDLLLCPCAIANSGKTNIAILDSVQLVVKDSVAKATGTDGQALIVKEIDVTNIDDFNICIEAKKLQAVLQNYDDDEKLIGFEFIENKVVLKYGRSKITIATSNADDYPAPNLTRPTQYSFSCSASNLIKGVSEIMYARSKVISESH